MRILVTGATGYIGARVCETLQASGRHVAALVRSADKRAAVEALGYEALAGDLTDLKSLRGAAAGVEALA